MSRLLRALAAAAPLTFLACVDSSPGRAQQAELTPRAAIEALVESGKYDEAIEKARTLITAPLSSAGAELWFPLAQALVARGRLAEAESAYTKALAAHQPDNMRSAVALAVLKYERGQRDSALTAMERIVSGGASRVRTLPAGELVALATAYEYLGRHEPTLFHDALRVLDAAAEADSADVNARVRIGELMLEKYNSAGARDALDEALRIRSSSAPALIAKAKVLRFDGEAGAASLAQRALEANPALAEAHTFVALLALDVEDHAAAAAAARRALEVNPASVEALSMLAAARWLAGDEAGLNDALARAAARSPRSAEPFVILSEVAARNRFYRDAAAFARKGIAADSMAWRAHGAIGINALRTGDVALARRHLEVAFAGDPYDVWIKNTLDLLDTFGEYEEVSTPRFRLFLHRSESQLLSLYLPPLLEEGYDALSSRYGYRPAPPIRMEIYPRHADFSVRTVGLAGLGALGVSFGNVLAMDSPAARPPGEFNWASTAWHELAHAFTLGLSEHKVPRWLSEGISVLEERRARPSSGWGAHASPSFLAAYHDGRLPPLSKLNDGFVRPSYPEQVIHSYYQASLACEMIERDWGPRALRDMLLAYRDGLQTAAVVKRVIKVDAAELDRRFETFLRDRFPATAKQYVASITEARSLLDAGKEQEAIKAFGRAKALFPDYAGQNSPYVELARIHSKRGDSRLAVAELQAIVRLSESDRESNVTLASLLDSLGDPAGAAVALERAILISPANLPEHERLASLYARTGNRQGAIRERRAVLALQPVDKAEAFYQLALAYHEAGESAAARREVLRSLEHAPSFEKAQELLLELRRGKEGTER
ncbi:MAG: tetratricopeptide repeat protein [Gemmatimonadaceae bacterium]